MSDKIPSLNFVRVEENDTSISYAMKRIGYNPTNDNPNQIYTIDWLKYVINDTIFTRLCNESDLRKNDIIVLEKGFYRKRIPTIIDNASRIITTDTDITCVECFVMESSDLASRLIHDFDPDVLMVQHPVIEILTLNQIETMQYESKYIIRYRYPKVESKVVVHC